MVQGEWKIFEKCGVRYAIFFFESKLFIYFSFFLFEIKIHYDFFYVNWIPTYLKLYIYNVSLKRICLVFKNLKQKFLSILVTFNLNSWKVLRKEEEVKNYMIIFNLYSEMQKFVLTPKNACLFLTFHYFQFEILFWHNYIICNYKFL